MKLYIFIIFHITFGVLLCGDGTYVEYDSISSMMKHHINNNSNNSHRELLMHNIGEQRLIASNRENDDRFGRNIVKYNNITVVCAFLDDHHGKDDAGQVTNN